MSTTSKLMVASVGVLALAVGTSAAEPASASPEAAAFFEKEVRPVLAENCFRCHGPRKERGGLRLDSLGAALQGGDGGPAVVPGKPDESPLVKAVRHQDGLKMPPDKALPRPQVEALAAWVKMGAPWPGAGRPGPTKPTQLTITDGDRSHWSFRPVERPAVPALKDAGRVANPIDAFILARLEAQGLTPSGPAGKRELARRLYFDLTGLPPTPEEVDAFVNDPSAGAYEKLVDRLLASPRYGERWGRHWLDVVRFAQSNGYERDGEKPNVWRYRDYIIDSFNEDKPYDRFVMEQLAGDELEPVSDEGRIATAFYRLGVWDDEPDDARQAEFDNLDDMVSTAGETFLGLTVGCARCHDHKFDPVAQEDYYSLVAFLRNVRPYRNGKGGAQLPLQAGGETLGVTEGGAEVPATYVLFAGQVARRGKAVPPRFPRALCRTDAQAVPKDVRRTATTSGRRRALAEWVASRDNPLTARVVVNRLWHWHFGRGLAATPSDLGRNGSPPSHPELIDWLARELMEGGWRLKRVQKLIVMSHTYRQASAVRDDRAAAVDPGNVLLHRQNLRRLEAEAIRDAVLAMSGKLNLKMGGHGIFPLLPREVLETQSRPGNGWNTSPPEEQGRRSVYVFVKRTLGVPLLETFDFASPDKSVAARTTTTIAPQALILLNSSFVEEQSAAFADRLLADGGGAGQHVERAFRLALGRVPTPKERQIALAYLDRARAAIPEPSSPAAYRQALAGVCKLVFNLNEFVYVD